MSFFGYIFLFLVLRWLYSLFVNSSTTTQRTGAPFQQRSTTVSPEDFELHLLTLSSIVMKADGKVTQNEMQYVQQYFVSSYGKDRANAIFKVFNEVVKKREINPARVCQYLNARTRYESRLQILHFLFGIAQADGHVSSPEVNMLQQIAGYLRLTQRDFISIKAMFVKDQDNAYKILEIDKSVPDHEVKKAYRTMAKKYHPDKLIDMDEAYKKGAEEKFRKVQEAYETIQKERGMV
ncbi:tellurite resistance TerB family protein [Nonlabens agnitus]|uniref:Molecular chaperone DjlA n=1 Tax=Nonlabens agnitus TaxID=870484 RepID=A0A2S9WWN2_9FLAO|nr:TerB family tellurite resistance protein [Nonlabens agnitus]PRP67889.1 molecular chaperone DjlA [Nonlabens agnitus]